MERIKQLTSHLAGNSTGLAALHRKSADDVVITMAIRSLMLNARKYVVADFMISQEPNVQIQERWLQGYEVRAFYLPYL
jgi:hypothetical protein